jgi:exosortase
MGKTGCELTGTECARGALKNWCAIALFAVVWLDLVRQLSFQWSASEQYAYGWFVPVLAAGLFFRRWVSRPAPRPGGAPLWMAAAAGVLALSLLPIRVVFEINPDWPLPGWLACLAVVGLSLYALYLMGGRPWLWHFAFPVCFILAAVRWPYRPEHALTHGLMRLVAGLTAELLDWMNITVEQAGNLLRVGSAVVGIDEACSGIRSFQSTLMGALFMGELYRMRWPVRLGFVAGGLGLAFLFNVLRTLLLTWRAASGGLAALERWHDAAGFGVFLASFLCLWAAAALLARGKQGGLLGPREPSGGDGAAKCVIPRAFLAATGCWMIAVLALTEAWYRTHEVPQAGLFHWSVRLPETKPDFEKVELPSQTVRMLAYDAAATGRWREEDGSLWTLGFFRWKPMSVQSVIHARMHRPDVCLPAAGFEQLADLGVVRLPAGGLGLPFRKYIYEAQGRRLYVFFCQWEDGAERQAGMAGSEQAERVFSAFKGRRWLGQQTLELVIVGYESLEQAERQLREELPGLIAIEKPKL